MCVPDAVHKFMPGYVGGVQDGALTPAGKPVMLIRTKQIVIGKVYHISQSECFCSAPLFSCVYKVSLTSMRSTGCSVG